MDDHHKDTNYGFEWNAAEVKRLFSHNGAVHLAVETPRQTIIIYVTKTGLIRVFKDGKGEMKAP